MYKIANVLIISVFCVAGAFSQSKRALVIAIGTYAENEGHGWKKISSVNDTSYILPVLRQQGFSPALTKVLVNGQATIEGINESFNTLLKEAKKGEVVYIHVSSHGSQIEDNNGDELDNFDESIVTYNAISPKYSTNYELDQKQYLRDDDFGIFIEKLREKLGPEGDVLVVMDNCHSGSGTRNIGDIVRGGEPPLVKDKKATSNPSKDLSLFKEKSTNKVNLASYVVISASRAEEANTELKLNDKGVGSLSYSVAKAFDIYSPQLTYRGFFAQIQSSMNEMVPRQHPVLEGDGIDRELFGGQFVLQPDFIELKVIEDPKLIIVKAGTIAGLTKNSKIAVYPSGTVDTSGVTVSAGGVVISSDNFTSIVELDRDLKKTQAADYWVFIKETHYPMRPVILSYDESIKSKNPNVTPDKLKNSLKSTGLVSFEGKADLTLYYGKTADSLLDCLSGYTWEIFDNSKDYSADLKKSVERYVQYQFLKSYTIQDKDFPISMRIIPYINGKADTTSIGKFMKNGVYEFKEGNQFVVEIRNNSKYKIYFNIIDLQPNGVINAIMPNKTEGIKSEELYINPFSTETFDSFPVTIYPPFGDEVFKVFLARDKLDLEYITINKTEGTRSFMTDLETVFKNSYKPSTRGDFGTSDGSVMNLNFRIIEN